MEFVSRFEELAEKRGRNEGRIEGRNEGRIEGRREAFASVLEAAELMLTDRFGPEGAAFFQQLQTAAELPPVQAVISQIKRGEPLAEIQHSFDLRQLAAPNRHTGEP